MLTHLCCLDELLYDVRSLDHGDLPENVTHNPYGDAVEQLDTLVNAGSVLGRLGRVGIHTELTELGEEERHCQEIHDTSVVG